MAKARKVKVAAPTSFPLSLGWVVSLALGGWMLLPMFSLILLIAIGPQTSQPEAALIAAIVVGAMLALIIALNLPGFVRTLRSDRCVVLGDHALHVPVIKLFQRRPWTIPFTELMSITAPRKSGGSTQIVLALRSGRLYAFSASVIQDRHALLSAVDRRIGPSWS
ncbi:hypothetical protein BH11MYX3_BH11MYX3_07320 [soil metagenome]